MTDKLEALSHPVAVVVNKYGDPEAFGEREIKLLADLQKVPYNTNFYSQEYVTALLAALEEKDQRIKELEDDVRFERLRLNETEIAALIKRADAAEQREEHLKADAAVMGQRIADLEVTQMTGPLSLVLKRAAELERIIEGVDQLAIDGGWTARKMSEYAKSLEMRNAELERANAAQNDHINQQQDRIDTLENKNGELGKYAGELQQRLQQPIKLPKKFAFVCDYVMDAGEVRTAIRAAGFKVEGE